MADEPTLVSLFWTTAGIPLQPRPVSRFSFRARVEAAARAGFRGIGLWHDDLWTCLESSRYADLRSLLSDNGMVELELELLTDWFEEGPRRVASDGLRDRLLEASQALGASHIKVGDFSGRPVPFSQAVDAFGSLCSAAGAYGATIGFEFMKGNTLGTLGEALALVEAVDSPHGGLIVDIVQQVNLGIPLADIGRIPARRLVSVELNDGLLPGTQGHDMALRRFCGEGEFDVAGFLGAVWSTGYGGPWAVEVFHPDLVKLDLDELSRRAYQTTRLALNSVWRP